MSYRGRFAPSPTGLLHVGSAATALLAAARARQQEGALLLRVEDLDTPRVVRGASEAILDDLNWLGIAFDEGPREGGPFAPYEQSKRGELYAGAIERLAARELTYLCDCSRAEISRVASAPHDGEEGPRYPGTCRAFGMRDRDFKRAPAVRLAVPEGCRIAFDDGVVGRVEEEVAATTGDFVLRRGDGVFSYQLAVVVDDLAMGITEVVRGRDLLGSTARQILLAELLGGRAPAFAHVPLVVGPGGARLAKRAPGVTVRSLREAGHAPSEVVSAIASALGFDLGSDSLRTPKVAASSKAERLIELLSVRLDLGRLRDVLHVEVPALR